MITSTLSASIYRTDPVQIAAYGRNAMTSQTFNSTTRNILILTLTRQALSWGIINPLVVVDYI